MYTTTSQAAAELQYHLSAALKLADGLDLSLVAIHLDEAQALLPSPAATPGLAVAAH